MSTIWHCNKERERNTHLCVKEASWNIASLLSYLKSRGIAPPPAPHSGGPWHFGDSIWRFSTCGSRQIQALYRGGWLGLPSHGLSPKHKELVFWLFLLSYMTSGPFSWWYFLLWTQPFFWYYFSRQVMAILCCVAQKAVSAAHSYFPKSGHY
jgi:hypothetical protein